MPKSIAMYTAIGILCACSEPELTTQFNISFIALTDENEPLQGVRISASGQQLGATDQDGLLNTSLRGIDGQHLDTYAECPEGYEGPKKDPKIVLRKFNRIDSEVSVRSKLKVVCHPLMRAVVVAIKTNWPNIPIVSRGQELAMTNSNGVAHVLLDLPSETDFRIVLDTHSKPELRPQNPSRIFSVTNKDEFWVWTPEFEVFKKRKRTINKEEKSAPVHVPYRLD